MTVLLPGTADQQPADEPEPAGLGAAFPDVAACHAGQHGNPEAGQHAADVNLMPDAGEPASACSHHVHGLKQIMTSPTPKPRPSDCAEMSSARSSSAE